MDRYILKNRITSGFLLQSYDNATQVRVPRREPGDFLIDNSKVYSKHEFFQLYANEDLKQMRADGRHQYTTVLTPESIQCVIGGDGTGFRLKVITELSEKNSECSTSRAIELTRKAISNIIDLDVIARARVGSVHGGTDHDPLLAWFRVNEDELELHYHSTACNTEWGVFFEKDKDDDTWSFVDWG